MKQKNLILVAVAVGCGLVAAVLTANLGARPSEPKIEQVEVPVAAKDLPLNQKLTKEEIDNCVTLKKFSKDSLPPVYVATKEELIDKKVSRQLRAGDTFNPADLANKASIEIPAGHNAMTVPISRDQLVGGFAVPGSKVDILAAVTLQKENAAIVFPLLIDKLILAVDTNPGAPQGAASQSVGDVSLAVSKQDALLLHGAIKRGASMRMVLRGTDPEKEPKYAKVYTEAEIWAILRDDMSEVKMSSTEANPGSPKTPGKGEFVPGFLPVPTEEIEAGTRLTKELIDSKFVMVKIVPPAPDNVIVDVRGHVGQYVVKGLAPNLYVPKSFLSATPPYGKGTAPEDGATPKAAPAAEPEATYAPPVYHDVTVHTTSGVRKYRYLKTPAGEWKFQGQLRVEDTPDPEHEKTKPEPKAAPADGEKKAGGRVVRADV